MFRAESGNVLISSDYSAQEPRLTAQMCQDEGMIKAYKDGKDLYAEIASIAFNETYEACLEFRPDGTTNKEGKLYYGIMEKIGKRREAHYVKYYRGNSALNHEWCDKYVYAILQSSKNSCIIYAIL